MRVEDFDSKLRQKLSHIEPGFQEKDWLRFQHKFLAKERKPWKPYLLLLLLLITIGGVAFSYLHNSDTRHSKQSPQKQIIIADGKAEDKEPETRLPSQKDEFIQNEMASELSISSGSEKILKQKTVNNKFKSQEFINTTTEIGKHQIVSENKNKNFKTISEVSSKAGEPIVIAENLSENELPNATVALTQKINLIPFSTLQSSFPDETFQHNLKLQKPIGIDKWAAGLSLIAAQEHTSYGVVIERKTNSNVSFRSGILYQNFYEKEYQNEIAFKEDNQVAFSEIAKPRHSTTEEFSNIRIQSSEVVCPLELKYTIPFSSKMAAFVFGGVQLTLQSKTVLDFDYLNHFTNQYLSESGLDQASNSSTLINNFGFGLGIQRNFAGLQWSLAGVMQKSNSNLPHIAKRTWGLQGGVSFVF